MPGPRDEPPPVQRDPTAPDPALAEQEFDHFCAAQTLKGILGHHRRLCAALNLTPGRWAEFYPKLKGCIKSWKAQGLFSKFDKRAAHKCYGQGQACVDSNVLVVGAGPCGLRAAIEAQLLGARVLVLEKRDRLSRNNVLHLWPMVIHDLKALGAKKFFGKFCAGSIDHISIRQLQCILLKVALLLGVEVCENVGYEELLDPPDELTGWRARVSPPHHPAANFQFDVLIGADGKRNTFPCFRRKEFRGKLAIAITANFVNGHSEWEARVDEISGVAFIFNQKFFKDLNAATGIELENIVYYKDDTHYFVMTAKKQSLIAKGVLLEDRADTASLLSAENISRDHLMAYACEAASFSTEGGLEPLRFARNHYGLEDVAMFDFTSMFASCHASALRYRNGHGLLLQLVGDSLLEPFWPTGSGCARGFLSCFDAAWQLRSWCDLRAPALQCVSERESVYRLLAQTTPENLSGDLSAYTIDPRTRYPNLNTEVVLPGQVRALVDTDDPAHLAAQLAEAARRGSLSDAQPLLKRPYLPLRADRLLLWIRRRLLRDAEELTDLAQCLRSGGMLCALLASYRPEVLAALEAEPGLERALQVVEEELGVPARTLLDEQGEPNPEDPQAAVVYLSQVWDALHGQPAPVRPRLQDPVTLSQLTPERRAAPDGGADVDSDTLRRQRKRKSEAIKQGQRSSDSDLESEGSPSSDEDATPSPKDAAPPSPEEARRPSLGNARPPLPEKTECVLRTPVRRRRRPATARTFEAPPSSCSPQHLSLVQAAFRAAASAPPTPGGGVRRRLDQRQLDSRLAVLQRQRSRRCSWLSDSVPGDISPGEDSPNDTSPGDATPRDAFPANASPADAFPGDASPQDTSSEEASPRDTSSANASPRDTFLADASSRETAPGEDSPRDTAPGDASPGDTSSRETAPGDASSRDTAPGETYPRDTAPGGDSPRDTSPGGVSPREAGPEAKAGGPRGMAARRAAVEEALRAGAAPDQAAGFDDFTVHLYRKTAAGFHQRRQHVQEMVFEPSRHTPQAKRQVVPALSSKEQFDSKVKDLEAKFSGTYQPPPDQQLKPASRVIGRIDKSDWNVQQIERKIEENSRAALGRHRDGLGRASQQLDPLAIRPGGAGFDLGRRGQNRVAEMAERFQARAGGGDRPAARAPVAPSQVGERAAPASSRLRRAAGRVLARLRSLALAGACYYLAAHALALVVSDAAQQLRW